MGLTLSRRKKHSDEAPVPPTSAGLLSFWGEKTDSFIKVRPELVMVFVVILIIAVILANTLIQNI